MNISENQDYIATLAILREVESRLTTASSNGNAPSEALLDEYRTAQLNHSDVISVWQSNNPA